MNDREKLLLANDLVREQGMSSAQANAFVEQYKDKSLADVMKVIAASAISELALKDLQDVGVLRRARAGDRDTEAETAKAQATVLQAQELIQKNKLSIPQLLWMQKYGYTVNGVHYGLSSVGHQALQVALTAVAQTEDSLATIRDKVLKIGKPGEQVPFEEAGEVLAKYLDETYGKDNIHASFINEQISKIYAPILAGPEAAARLAENRSKYKNLAFEFLDLFPDVSAEDLESHSPKANAAWDWLNGREGSKRAGQGALTYAEFKPFADAYNLMRGFPNALRKLVKEQVEFDLTSIPPKDIKGLGKFYDDYKINSDPKHSLLALSRNQKFLNDAQTLAPPFWEFINKSIRAEADSSLAGPDMDAKKLNARIQSLSLNEIGELQALNEDFLELDEDGKPTKRFLDVSANPEFQKAWQNLPEALRKTISEAVEQTSRMALAKIKLRADTAQSGKQALEGEAAQETIEQLEAEKLANGGKLPAVKEQVLAETKSKMARAAIDIAEASNAAQLARVTKWGLDMAENMMNGGRGIQGITRNLLGGNSLGGIVANQMGESGAVPCSPTLRFAGLPQMGGIGGNFAGMGRGMAGRGHRADAGDMAPDALVRLAMNNPGQLAERMEGLLTGASGRQPRPDQRAMELPTKTAKVETRKPLTHVAAARHDISDG
jgi:hypothetical protein